MTSRCISGSSLKPSPLLFSYLTRQPSLCPPSRRSPKVQRLRGGGPAEKTRQERAGERAAIVVAALEAKLRQLRPLLQKKVECEVRLWQRFPVLMGATVSGSDGESIAAMVENTMRA